MGDVFILLPNQLFELSYIPKERRGDRFILVEHEFYYKYRQYNLNKKKLVLLKAAAAAYIASMTKHLHVEIIPVFPPAQQGKRVTMFDCVDKPMMEMAQKHFAKCNFVVLDSPNFLLTRTDIAEYYAASKGKFFHASFYRYQLDKCGIKIAKTYDTENRKPVPANIEAPPIPTQPPKQDARYIVAATEFVNAKYAKNYGTCDGFYLPVTHATAKQWFDAFLASRIKYFADYQDAIVPGEALMFHSGISSVMNIGLLQPSYVVDKLRQQLGARRITARIFETILRQIIGWREYQRYIYVAASEKITASNYFGNTRKLSEKWYTGTTGIAPLDDAIRLAFAHGYIHHILRLMVVANCMNLCGIHPMQAYRWFMEFSTDSYEWVMVGNVLSMGLYADGGLTMRKPYLCSSNYVQKMSGKRYPAGKWENEWDALYYSFLLRNRHLLTGTPLVVNIKYAETVPAPQRKRWVQLANEVLHRLGG